MILVLWDGIKLAAEERQIIVRNNQEDFSC